MGRPECCKGKLDLVGLNTSQPERQKAQSAKTEPLEGVRQVLEAPDKRIVLSYTFSVNSSQ